MNGPYIAALTGAVALCSLFVAAAMWPEPATLPSRELTPGLIASTSIKEICAGGYAGSHRGDYNPEVKRAVMKIYGIPAKRSHLYQLDHLIPLCLGGSNDPRNLWPQPLHEAEKKDGLEKHLCREMCALSTQGYGTGRADELLRSAQTQIADDWRQSYFSVFGRSP